MGRNLYNLEIRNSLEIHRMKIRNSPVVGRINYYLHAINRPEKK